MKKYIKSVVVLTLICAVVSALMAVTNYFTAPIIAKNEASASNEALLVVFPNGESFEEIDLTKYQLPASIKAAYKEKSGGYVFQMEVSGYSSGMVIMCGIDANGNVIGAVCLSSGETLGHEKTYGETVKGASIDTIDAVATVAGATKTSEGYKGAIKDALNAFAILNGGSVDLRTEEEKFNDELSATLPQADGKFTKWFMVEKLEGVSAVYVADNGNGAVYIVDDKMIAVGKDGKVISTVSDEERQIVETAAAIVASSVVEEIDLSQYEDMPRNILKAYKTESGNYVFDIRASGYSIEHSYGPGGDYIYITVSLTEDGEIIDCLTTKQSESKGIGDACADEDYYGQYDGKTEDTYTEVDAISGATITSNGYNKAIGNVFKAMKILKGDA